MKLSLIIFFVLVSCLSYEAEAQFRKKAKNGPPAAGYTPAPSSLEPNSPKEAYEGKGSKKNRKVSRKTTYDQQREYYERVEAVAKAREKTAKIMEKPQYSDPMYFGHKKKPKKRPPHKMRFCKECGIRH